MTSLDGDFVIGIVITMEVTFRSWSTKQIELHTKFLHWFYRSWFWQWHIGMRLYLMWLNKYNTWKYILYVLKIIDTTLNILHDLTAYTFFTDYAYMKVKD